MTIDGTYKYTQRSPMGEVDGQIELHADGDILTGKMFSPMGTEEIHEGKINGNELEWIVKKEGPPMGKMKVKFKVTLNGDVIEGKVKPGILPGMPFKATRE